MTLKDYTDFVTTYKYLDIENLGPELVKLLGSENFRRFSELLLKKSKEGGGQGFFLYKVILGNRELFLSTLSEFCEPLLVKETAEKPEGGQDAKIL
jgi:hypothetical protein